MEPGDLRGAARLSLGQTAISFQSQYSVKIQEWVVAGLFEIGVCELPLLQDGLRAHLVPVELMLALPEANPLTRHDILTPQMLAGEPFIVMGPEHVTHRRLREAFDSAGVALRTRVHSHLFKNLLGFVQEGMGCALLDPFALDFDSGGGSVIRKFRPRLLMEMAVITSRDRPLSTVGQEFLDLLIGALEPYRAE